MGISRLFIVAYIQVRFPASGGVGVQHLAEVITGIDWQWKSNREPDEEEYNLHLRATWDVWRIYTWIKFALRAEIAVRVRYKISHMAIRSVSFGSVLFARRLLSSISSSLKGSRNNSPSWSNSCSGGKLRGQAETSITSRSWSA
jgi:hypothetical protein